MNLCIQSFDSLTVTLEDARRSYLSDGGLGVEHEVAERSLENPSELRQEAGVVGDGSGARGAGCDLTLSDSF